MEELLTNKNSQERADIKATEIAKLDLVTHHVFGDGLEVEILSVNKIDGGVEIMARAWKGKGQIGFGHDGSVDVERFRIFNPPVLVADPNGPIVRTWEEKGEIKTRTLREDPEQAILDTLAHTIKVAGKEESINIIMEKIGNTTDTFFPDADPETNSVDGTARRTGVSENFATIRAGAGSSARDNQAGEEICDLEGSGANFIEMIRGIFGFNTAAIPDTDTISAATFSIAGRGVAHQTGLGDTDVDITTTTTGSNTALVASDFNVANFGTTRLATGIALSVLSSVDGVYNDFTLNASGIAAVNKTGVTFLAARLKWDFDNSGPSASTAKTSFNGYTADQTGTTADPKLVVVHAAGATASIQKVIIF